MYFNWLTLVLMTCTTDPKLKPFALLLNRHIFFLVLARWMLDLFFSSSYSWPSSHHFVHPFHVSLWLKINEFILPWSWNPSLHIFYLLMFALSSYLVYVPSHSSLCCTFIFESLLMAHVYFCYYPLCVQLYLMPLLENCDLLIWWYFWLCYDCIYLPLLFLKKNFWGVHFFFSGTWLLSGGLPRMLLVDGGESEECLPLTTSGTFSSFTIYS